MTTASPTDYLSRIRMLSTQVMQLRQEMLWILAGQLLGLAGGFIGIKVLTNLIGPKGYGQLALGLTIAGIFNLYVYGPVANVVARFFAVYRDRGTLGVYFAVLKKSHRGLAAGLTFLSLLAGGITWLVEGREWAAILFVSLMFGIASGVYASYFNLLNAMRQRGVVALHQGADVWLRIGLAVVFIFLFRNSGLHALLGYLAGTIVVAISFGAFALRQGDVRLHWEDPASDSQALKDCSREFLGYASPFVAFAGFGAISLFADRWILQLLFGEGDVGIYSAIYSIANAPIVLFFAIINQMIVPIIFEKAGAMTTSSQAESSAGLLRLTVTLASIAVLLITCVAYFLSEPLVRMFTNETFAAYHEVLWVSVLGLSIANIGQLFALKGLYLNRPKVYLWPKGLQAGSFLVLGYLLGKRLGIMGMAIALCCSAAVHLAWVLLANKRIDRHDGPCSFPKE